MWGLFEDQEDQILKSIEYSQKLYCAQADKVEQEEYIKKLLFNDFVGKVKMHTSRYDSIFSMIREAQSELNITDKRKKRSNLDFLTDCIRTDFLNGDTEFNIVKIISGGYETYCWTIDIEWHGKDISIDIPVMNHIDGENIQYANGGMFTFGVWKSKDVREVLCCSYKIEDVAKFIKEYFENETE